MHTLYDAVMVVFRALARKHDVFVEMNQIMAGKILKFTADESYEAGVKDGEKKGEKNGEKKGMMKLQDIISGLDLKEDHEALIRLIYDEGYRDEMYLKFKNDAS